MSEETRGTDLPIGLYLTTRVRTARAPSNLPRSYRTASALLLICLFGLCLACVDPMDEGTASRPHIVLITVDTLRPDHLSLYGYDRETSPNLSRIFSRGAVFENAYATQSNTGPSITSILSGLYPQDHGVRLLYQKVPDTTVMLSQMLPQDYQSIAFVSNFVLTDEAIGLASRFDHFDDVVTQPVPGRDLFERSAKSTTDTVLAWLATEFDPERPMFLWVHYIDPHGPYFAPPPFGSRFEHEEPIPIQAERVPAHQQFEKIFDGLEYIDRYDEEIAFTDAEIGRLLHRADDYLNLDESLIVLTADHGESMMEHESWFAHGYHVYEEIARVPLAISGPGVPAGRYRTATSGVDIVPTILEYVGAETTQFPPPAVLTGVDILDNHFSTTRRTLYSEATRAKYRWRLAIAESDRWMTRIDLGSGRVVTQLLFNLVDDPEQLVPLPWRGDPTERLLAARIAADPIPLGQPEGTDPTTDATESVVDPRADAASRSKLRALGYVN